MRDSSTIDIDAALQSPASVFDQPMDVVKHTALNRDVKLKLLEQWERDARALAVAEEEGMIGGEESMLSRVHRAMRAMDDRVDPAAHVAIGADTKFGP
jgi:hypothetical protein